MQKYTFVIFFSLIFSSKAFSLDEQDLEGTWKSPCYRLNSTTFISQELVFLDYQQLKFLHVIFLDKKCKTPLWGYFYSLTYHLGESEKRATEFNMTVIDVHAVVFKQPYVDFFNETHDDESSSVTSGGLCESGDWEVLAPQRVSGRLCEGVEMSETGDLRFNMISLLDKKIYMNFKRSTDKAKNRPYASRSFYFRKVQSN